MVIVFATTARTQTSQLSTVALANSKVFSKGLALSVNHPKRTMERPHLALEMVDMFGWTLGDGHFLICLNGKLNKRHDKPVHLDGGVPDFHTAQKRVYANMAMGTTV